MARRNVIHMAIDFSKAESVMREALGRVFPAAQIQVRWRGETILWRAYGWLDPEAQQQPTQLDTLFDLASVTKLFVITAFMTLVEEGRIALDQPVCTVLPEFEGPRPIRAYDNPLEPGKLVDIVPPTQETADAGRVTFRHLLAHNSGLPAWRPLYKAGSPEAARRLALTTYFSYPSSARAVYSDIGLILLGMSIERLTGLTLDQAVHQRVAVPLGLTHTGYLPIGRTHDLTCAPTEVCAWRNRRIVGQVHDENAAGLGGVAGHAGIFSTAKDTATLGQMYLDCLGADLDRPKPDALGRPPGAPRLRSDTVAEMARLHAIDGTTQRGLGFALWCPDPEASGNPFSQRAFGHTGFTGTSLWMDPQRALVVACLTNRVYYGRNAGGIIGFRAALHRAIVAAVDEQP